MVDNPLKYGFIYHHTIGGGPRPTPIKHFIDTAESFDVNSGLANAALAAGDLVRIKSSGGLEQADGTENTTEAAYGVVMSIGPYWDGSVMKPANALPSDTAWGTNLARRSTAMVVPVNGVAWSVAVDDTTTATTRATYDALIMSNVDHILTGATGDNPARLNPKIDISTTNTTNTLVWRIIGIDDTVGNLDYSGANVRVIVRANISQQDSTTGL